MKKILTIMLSTIILFSMTISVFASEGEKESKTSRIHITESSNLTSSFGIGPRAISKPTSYAPGSWYNVKHNWTAKNYTYSSYIFDTSAYPYLDIAADVPFTVDLYRADGSFMASVSPNYNTEKGKYYGAYFFYADEDFYMIIHNNSGSAISSGAWYKVGNSF